MDLSAVQQDALIELINIGFGRAGAAGFINKPFDRADILSALDTALAGAR